MPFSNKKSTIDIQRKYILSVLQCISKWFCPRTFSQSFNLCYFVPKQHNFKCIPLVGAGFLKKKKRLESFLAYNILSRNGIKLDYYGECTACVFKGENYQAQLIGCYIYDILLSARMDQATVSVHKLNWQLVMWYFTLTDQKYKRAEMQNEDENVCTQILPQREKSQECCLNNFIPQKVKNGWFIIMGQIN